MLQQPDLRTRAGCVQYVEATILPQVTRVFALRRQFPPIGMVFATRVNGAVVPEPRATPVNTPPIGGREIRRMMQKVVVATESVGSVFVRQDDFKLRAGGKAEVTAIVAQLEHKSFGDVVWMGYVKGGVLEPWVGPMDVNTSPVQVNALRFLAHRWMS